MAASVILTVNRVLGLEGIEPSAFLTVYQSGTTTPVSVYANSDLTGEYSTIQADENGLLPPLYVADASPLRLVATRPDGGGTVPGYPQDNVVPVAASSSASSIPFTPTETLPFSNVEDAINGAAALSTDQTDIQNRALTPWVTSGTGNAYTATPDPALTGYGTFLALRIRFNRANTGAATLNVNGLGDRNITKIDRTGTPAALVSGDIQPGDTRDLTFDGTQFVITGGVSTGANGGANGDYRLLPDGRLICQHRATLAYADSDSLSYSWTFPSALFIVRPHVTISLSGTAGDYTGVTRPKVGQPTFSGGTTSTTVTLWIVAGQSISPGASVANVGLQAIGRWF